MKTLASTLLLIQFLSAAAQIPNAGFELWQEDSAGTPPFVFSEPQDWFTYNSTDAFFNTSSVVPESLAHSGNLAAKIQTVQQGTGIYAGVLTLINLDAPDSGGAPISQKYLSLHGHLKYQTMGDDTVFAIAHLFKNITGVKSIIAEARGFFSGTQTTYTLFSLPFRYYFTTMPDSIDILFVVGEQSAQGFQFGTLGSFAIVDALTLTAIPAGVPEAPTGLVASPRKIQDTNGIRLDWDDNSNNETGFIIQRSLQQFAGFVTIDTTPANQLTYNDIGVTENVTYYYQLLAMNANGNSPPSNIAFATAQVSTGILTSKFDGGVRVFPNPANNWVNVAFPKNTGNSQIILLDMLGHKVFELKTDNSASFAIDLREIDTGTYLLQITMTDFTTTKKLSLIR